MTEKHILICITGIDGSGKTTLAKNLTKYLKKNQPDLHVKYVYGRYMIFLLKPIFLLSNKFFLRKHDINKDYNNYTKRKNYLFKKHSIMKKIYLKLILIDYILQLIIKIKIPLYFNNFIICDRYIFDTVITDLSVDMQLKKEDSIKLIKKSYRFVPQPNHILFIDVDEKIAFNRKDDVPSIHYLTDRRKRYRSILEEFNVIDINGNKSKNDVFNNIKGWINNEYVN